MKPINRLTQYQKDAVGEVAALGPIYGNGLWSFCAGDVLSMLTSGSSALMNWIPSRGVIHANETVAHLSWAGVPRGFDGSQTYGQFLADMDEIGDCDYGSSGAQFNVCEYTIPMFRVPFKSDTLQPQHFGLKYCENEPRHIIRGPMQGLQIDTDAAWALSQIAFQMNEHMNWSQLYGDPSAYKKTWYGLDNVIDVGWVTSHATGSGDCVFVDPQVFDGAQFTDAADLLNNMEAAFNKVQVRAMQRGYRLQEGDVAAVMSLSHWNWLAERLACGALILSCNVNVQVTNTVEGIRQEFERITTGGFGFGFIPFKNFNMPVLIEPNLGTEAEDLDGNSVTVGDIYILVRNFAGINVLEHQYLDWNRLTYPRDANERVMQNGMVRTGWVTEASRCYYYFAESYVRLVSRMQHLQIKYLDVVVPNKIAGENESGSYTHPNYYAYNGQVGGQGTALLTNYYGV